MPLGLSPVVADHWAILANRIKLLTRAVILVAGMRIPEAAREAVLARLTADRASQNGSPTER